MRRGYSLIEVFIALALVASVVVALAQLMPASMGSLRRSAQTTAACNLGQSYMETYRTMDFKALQGLVGQGVNVGPDTLDGVQYNTTVLPTMQADPDIIYLQVVVAWNNGSWTGMQTVQFNTCVFNVKNPY